MTVQNVTVNWCITIEQLDKVAFNNVCSINAWNSQLIKKVPQKSTSIKGEKSLIKVKLKTFYYLLSKISYYHAIQTILHYTSINIIHNMEIYVEKCTHCKISFWNNYRNT